MALNPKIQKLIDKHQKKLSDELKARSYEQMLIRLGLIQFAVELNALIKYDQYEDEYHGNIS